MSELRLTDLVTILRECAGEDEISNLDGDILDAEFGELGYDSIAMLETASRIQIRYGVVLSDEEVAEATSPRVLLHLVNRSLAETA
ncbi:acyl carrier protein [Embleya sp. NPDC008237]|uniref:acyl carrier protein n=1 Tax=Embleya sp. NPDC008237 TaxID=3363978 RepID=UPI0036E3996A